MKLLNLLALVAFSSAKNLEGSVFFTSLSSGDLVRLDCGNAGCGAPVIVTTGLENYGGLLPWESRLVAALKNQQVVHMDPWCNDCPKKTLVDMTRAVGQATLNVRGMTWCQDALFIVFLGSNASGLLRCTECLLGEDCTANCLQVDGDLPGNGSQQLSEFAASVACWKDKVLVADNSNFRLQAVPAQCSQKPCKVETFAWNLLWPLGLLVVDEKLLVTLDDSIVFFQDGTRHNFSSKGDNGFLCSGDGRILVASGHDGNVVSYDPNCDGPDCIPALVWNSTGTSARAATAIAYMRRMSTVTV